MMAVRQWHTYLGALIAPSVLFFAITGSLQLFHFHEAHGGYAPPPILKKLGAVHKDQKFAVDEPTPGPKHVHADEPEPLTVYALK